MRILCCQSTGVLPLKFQLNCEGRHDYISLLMVSPWGLFVTSWPPGFCSAFLFGKNIDEEVALIFLLPMISYWKS